MFISSPPPLSTTTLKYNNANKNPTPQSLKGNIKGLIVRAFRRVSEVWDMSCSESVPGQQLTSHMQSLEKLMRSPSMGKSKYLKQLALLERCSSALANLQKYIEGYDDPDLPGLLRSIQNNLILYHHAFKLKKTIHKHRVSRAIAKFQRGARKKKFRTDDDNINNNNSNNNDNSEVCETEDEEEEKREEEGGCKLVKKRGEEKKKNRKMRRRRWQTIQRQKYNSREGGGRIITTAKEEIIAETTDEEDDVCFIIA